MRADTINLTTLLIQELYGKILVPMKDDEEKVKTSVVETKRSLGNNKKNVSILVAHLDQLYLPADELEFLSGILSACKMTLDDVAIVNIEKTTVTNYKELEKEFKSGIIILFGILPLQIAMPIEFPHYQVQKFNSQIYVSAASLSIIQQHKEEKTKLWNCLKQLPFNE